MKACEVGFWFEMDCETDEEAEAILRDMVIKNPDTQGNVSPQWVMARDKAILTSDLAALACAMEEIERNRPVITLADAKL